METMRTFIAIPVSEEGREAVSRIEEDLGSVGADVKWVEPRNIHITVKFLGNVETRRISDLSAALTGSLKGTKSFEITLAGMGTFPPGKRNVRVVWIGITEGKEHLVEAAARVEEACATQGFAKEDRPFSPHLTIGRVRRESGPLADLARQVANLEFNPLKVRIDRVNLMRSELSPKGPTYTVLESFALEQI